ncbi:TolC family protein [Roseateles sp.]|uniref:TolC family protein n=1 Tax=Roseateles sp. TaxID=1971397 RepID=UPI0039EB5925
MKPIHRIRWGVAAALLGGCALVARAEPVTLARAVDAAWQRTQAGAASQAQVLRAQAERDAAASLLAAPPAVQLSQRSDRWQDNAGVREREIGVALPLWLPGQRSARQAAAEAELRSASAGGDLARLRLAGQLRELAWNLAGLRAERASLQAQQRYLQALAADVERRVRAGDLARTDALAAQGERLANEAELLAATQRLQAERERWTALTGLAADEVDATEPQTPDRELDGHPQLAQLAQAAEAARRQLDATRRDLADAPELSVGYRNERDAHGQPGRGSVTVGLRIPFGTAQRNLPLRAAAQGALDQALAEQDRSRLELAAELAIARSELQSADSQAAMQRERAGLLRQRATLLDTSFRAGETALPELLLAVQAAAQADATLARQQAALGQARARLLQAFGVIP